MLSLWHADPARATVVFLAGTMVHPLFYAEFLDGLAAEGFTVVGVHRQGHGKSPRTAAPLTWDALVGNARISPNETARPATHKHDEHRPATSALVSIPLDSLGLDQGPWHHAREGDLARSLEQPGTMRTG